MCHHFVELGVTIGRKHDLLESEHRVDPPGEPGKVWRRNPSTRGRQHLCMLGRRLERRALQRGQLDRAVNAAERQRERRRRSPG